MRNVGDIEKLIKKKIEIEPFELDEARRGAKRYRERERDRDDERPARAAPARSSVRRPGRPTRCSTSPTPSAPR